MKRGRIGKNNHTFEVVLVLVIFAVMAMATALSGRKTRETVERQIAMAKEEASVVLAEENTLEPDQTEQQLAEYR